MDKQQTVLNLAKQIHTVANQQPEQLTDAFHRIISKYKKQPEIIIWLGMHYYRSVNYNFARYCFEHLIRLLPNYYPAYNNLGLVLNRIGLARESAAAYKKALRIKPDYRHARSNLAFVLHYFGETGRDEILQAHKNIAEYAFPNSQNFVNNRTIEKSTDRKLRLGYLSGDFREHAVGQFIQNILKQHDRKKFEIVVFDTRNQANDPITEKLKQLDLTWVNLNGVVTQAACNKIVRYKIDILIDLAGHTSGGRSDIFSNRVAPVQLIYLGYPNTSGLPNMDFRIGDSYADLEEFANQNSEHMLRLPHALWNYHPWNDMPPKRQSSACQTNGFVTFGSANNHAKLQPEWLAVWARVLNRIPDSRLVLKSRALQSSQIVNDVLAIFERNGVNKRRIDLKHYSASRADHWREISKFDVALDSFPYHGTTTSCDSLWLGVPVITRAGNSHVSRTTASILHTLELDDWIADSDDQFIDLCVTKAADLTALKQLQFSLRDRMKSSSLIDSQQFMPGFEKVLREAWTIHCADD